MIRRTIGDGAELELPGGPDAVLLLHGLTGSTFELVPVAYDHLRLAAEMRAERLPEEFVETIVSGWWTTCLEILPARERLRGRF